MKGEEEGESSEINNVQNTYIRYHYRCSGGDNQLGTQEKQVAYYETSQSVLMMSHFLNAASMALLSVKT
jgi:hypothetical protein